MSRSAFAFFVAVVASATRLAQVPPSQTPTGGPRPLWTVSTGLAQPESAHYFLGTVFVSNINGQTLAKDGNGYITRIADGGKVIGNPWVKGLNAPKGIRGSGTTLWVADIDEVVSIDVREARITAHIPVAGSSFLNDLAIAPDGTIYVSHSNEPRIYIVKDGKSSVFVEGSVRDGVPNGLLVDAGRLILGTIGQAPTGGKLLAFDLQTKQRTQLTTENVGGIDGIEPAEKGAYFVTDVIGRRLLHVASNGKVTTLSTFDQACADIGVSPKMEQLVQAGIVFIPFLSASSVAAYDLYPLIRAAR